MKKLFLIIAVFISIASSAQFTQIQITNVKRFASYIELSYKMRFTLPAIYGTGANPIEGLDRIVAAYPDNFGLEIIPTTGTVIIFRETASVPSNVTLAQIKTQLQNKYSNIRTKLDNLTLDSWDSVCGLSFDGATWGSTNLPTDAPLPAEQNLGATATGATGAAVTLTLPAIPGKFHSITHICISAYSTAARTGVATPITVTSTNLPGNLAWTFATAAAIGTTDPKTIEGTLPIKSSIANTATTIVCPATTGIIWRVNVTYNTTNQ